MKKIPLVLLILLMTHVVFAQVRTITGVVVDKSGGEPIPGVNVVVVGTTNGVITDFDGKYEIEVKKGSILLFSFVGMTSQQIKVGDNTEINVTMIPDVVALEEVVAIGYGTVKKSDLTGSVSSIGSSEIAESQSTSFLSAMQGRMAGVNISSESGEPGSGINIQIRGAGSFYGSASPLFVIDGVQMDINPGEVATSSMGSMATMDPLSNLNPNDIESIEILKDASATAIFGSRGANGVVIVTTKSGKAGKSTLEYNGYVGISQTTKKLDVLNAEDYLDYQILRGNTGFYMMDTDNDGEYDIERDFSTTPSHNWQDEIFRSAITHSHTLSAGGSNGKSNYSASLGLLSQEGIIKNNDYERYNFRIKVDHEQSDRLSLGFNLNSSLSDQFGVTSNGGGGGGSYNGLTQLIIIANPWEVIDPNIDQTSDNYILPLKLVEDSDKSTRFMRLIGSFDATYKITPELAAVGTVGANVSNSKLKEFYPTTTSWGDTWGGKAGVEEIGTISYNTSILLRYNKTFNKKHRVNAMAAFETAHYNYENFRNIVTSFEDESTGVNDISKGASVNNYETSRWETNRISYLSRVNYTYADRYLFTASIRADGSDKFGAGSRWGYFPSGAFAWRVTQEEFMKEIKSISNVKLRLSYGETGNERIPAYSQYAKMENTYYAGNDVLMFGMAPSSRANPDLKWETTVQYNAGIDLGFFENRLSITYDYYQKQTNDMLVNTPVSSQSGYSSQWSNLGDIDNKGMELVISSVNIHKKDFSWETSFNISFNKNKVKSIGGAEYIPVTIGGGWLITPGRVIVGEPIGVMYGYVQDGIYQIDDFTWQDDSDPTIPHEDRTYILKEGVTTFSSGNPSPGSIRYKDLDGDDNVDDQNDRTIIGDSNPIHVGGLNNSFRYKNFDLSFLFQWSYGNDVFNAGKLRLNGYQTYMNVTNDYYNNFWTPDRPSNEYPGVGKLDGLISDYFVEDASYLRFKTVSIGYTLPNRFLRGTGLSGVKIYATGNNLYTWTNYSGFDPEVQSNNSLLRGYERTSYPRSRTITLGVNVKF